MSASTTPWASLRLCEDVTSSTECNCAPLSIDVYGEQFTLGRRPGMNDYVLNNQCISSMHLILSFVSQASHNTTNDEEVSVGGGVVKRMSTASSKAICLADMSTNGIYVNNILVGRGKTVHLKHGDQIELVRAAKKAFSRYNLLYTFVMGVAEDCATPPSSQGNAGCAETQCAPEPTGLLSLTERVSKRQAFQDMSHVFTECRLGSGSFASVFKSCRKGSETTGPYFAVKIIDRNKKLPQSDVETLLRDFLQITPPPSVFASVLDMSEAERSALSVEELDRRIVEELFSIDDDWDGYGGGDSTSTSGANPRGKRGRGDGNDCEEGGDNNNAVATKDALSYRGVAERREDTHKRLSLLLSAKTKGVYEKCLVEKLRWDRETIILRNISHPGLVSTFDVFHSPKTIEFVLEFAEGGTMLSTLTENGPMSELCGKVMIYQLLSAVSYLHKRGIVHRDIKLENILLAKPFSVAQFHMESVSRAKQNAGPNYVSSNAYADDFTAVPPEGAWPEAKLTDFGLSRVLGYDSSTMTTMCGTLLYAAPEVTHTKLREDTSGYTAAVDLYSLGVVAFALLMERPPYSHDRDRNGKPMPDRMNYSSAINWHRKPRPNSVLPLAPLSNVGKDLISQMLAIKPFDRITADRALCHPWFDDLPPSAKNTYRT